MIVRWGLDELPGVLEEVGAERPLLISTERWRALDLPGRPLPRRAVARGADGRREPAPSRPPGRRRLVALGGGSAIDTAKAVSAATGLPLVSIPTTYAGAEWTAVLRRRATPRRGMKGGGGGAHLAGIVYEPRLTLEPPRAETAGRR